MNFLAFLFCICSYGEFRKNNPLKIFLCYPYSTLRQLMFFFINYFILEYARIIIVFYNPIVGIPSLMLFASFLLLNENGQDFFLQISYFLHLNLLKSFLYL
jgi:hypothetical protein